METEHITKKIGILGGSFDPIHLGHINIAFSAYKEYGLEEVWFIPAGHSPNKDENHMAPADMRAEMVALAIEEYPFFKLSRIEIDTPETSYTYLTLTRLAARYPDVRFYFIMGADSLDYFEKWVHPEIICQKAVLLAAVRDQMDVAQIQKKIGDLQKLFKARIYPIYGGRTEVSSTELRKSFRYGNLSNKKLPFKVSEYIKQHQLYIEATDELKGVYDAAK